MRAVALLAALSLGSNQPRDRAEIVALGESGDVWNVPLLERILDQRSRILEEEAIEALEALARLDPESAVRRARRVPEEASLIWTARGILVENGDLTTIRLALRSYLESPREWAPVLARARDVRLRDFASGEPRATDPPRRLLSILERNLSRAREPAVLRALLSWAARATDPSAPRRVLQAVAEGTPYDARIESWLRRNAPSDPPEIALPGDPLGLQQRILELPRAERSRAIRDLAEQDHRALLGLPMSSAEIDRLHPFLARSHRRPIRERVRRAREKRGPALASHVLSPRASVEEKLASLRAMEDAAGEALASAGEPFYEAMRGLLGEEGLLSWISRTEAAAALARVPLPQARLRLEELGTADAVRAILEREDRVLSVPFLDRLRRGGEPEAARAAELALLSLGAPGASAFVLRELALREDLDFLLGPLVKSPLDLDRVEEVVAAAASASSPSPEAFAALFQLLERDPRRVSALSAARGPLADRSRLAMSLSGEARFLPLLVDLAAGSAEGASGAIREGAFLALAEAELGHFATRLHRLAGDADRETRFRAAAALAPSGEAWSLRLLLADLDPSSGPERRLARRAIARMPPARARELLEEMVSDGTAGSLGVLALLDLGDEASMRSNRSLQEKLWAILAEGVERGDETALLAASLLSHPLAIRAVIGKLESAW